MDLMRLAATGTWEAEEAAAVIEARFAFNLCISLIPLSGAPSQTFGLPLASATARMHVWLGAGMDFNVTSLGSCCRCLTEAAQVAYTVHRPPPRAKTRATLMPWSSFVFARHTAPYGTRLLQHITGKQGLLTVAFPLGPGERARERVQPS